MRKLSIILFFTIIFIGGKVNATEEILASITNDDNSNTYTFVANFDEQTSTLKSFYKDNYTNGKKIQREVLSAKELGRSGVLLERRGNYDVITLKSDNFDFERGGTITIDTLYNGLTGERKQYEIELARHENHWRIFNNKTIISKLHIQVNKKALVGSIGVKNIRME